MKNVDFRDLLRRFVFPAMMIAFGLIMLLDPDSAAAMISRLLGWAILLLGGVQLYGKLKSKNYDRMVVSLALVAGGLWLLNHPLALAKLVGIVLGILLIYHGTSNLKMLGAFDGMSFHSSWVVPGLTALLGAVLIIMPLITTRLVFSLGGIALAVMGIAELVNGLKNQDHTPQDPNIIDAL